MEVTDFLSEEIISELLKTLYKVSRKSFPFKSTAEQLITTISGIRPIIQEVKYSGNELPQFRQFQLDRFSDDLTQGLDLAQKVLTSARWNVYKNLQLARKMEKLDKRISKFLEYSAPLYVMADVSHARAEIPDRFDRIERRLDSVKIGVAHGGGGGGLSG